jgi:hypothetical protein
VHSQKSKQCLKTIPQQCQSPPLRQHQNNKITSQDKHVKTTRTRPLRYRTFHQQYYPAIRDYETRVSIPIVPVLGASMVLVLSELYRYCTVTNCRSVDL